MILNVSHLSKVFSGDQVIRDDPYVCRINLKIRCISDLADYGCMQDRPSSDGCCHPRLSSKECGQCTLGDRCGEESLPSGICSQDTRCIRNAGQISAPVKGCHKLSPLRLCEKDCTTKAAVMAGLTHQIGISECQP